jgi:DNA-binding NarL/FixJ family response regulator
MTAMTMADTKLTLIIVIPDAELRNMLANKLELAYSVEAMDNLAALESVAEDNAELILCHQSLLEEQQATKLDEIKQQFPDSRVLVIGPSRPIEIQITALKHGARGYFDETLSLDRLDEALKIIRHGEVWVERHVISGLIDELTDMPTISPEQQQALDTLSPKEREVAEQVSYGATNKMIAKSMNITERTVKAHLTTIFQKMSIPDRLSLAIFFRDLR